MAGVLLLPKSLVSLNYKLKELFCLLHLCLECMTSRIPWRMSFVKLSWFGLSVPEGYLFAFEEFLIFLAATSLSRLTPVLSTDHLNGRQSSHTSKDILLPSEASWVESTWSRSLKSGWESPFKNLWLLETLIFVAEARPPGIPLWLILQESFSSWATSISILQHCCSSLQRSSGWRKMKIQNEQNVFWFFSSDECGCQINFWLKYV